MKPLWKPQRYFSSAITEIIAAAICFVVIVGIAEYGNFRGFSLFFNGDTEESVACMLLMTHRKGFTLHSLTCNPNGGPFKSTRKGPFLPLFFHSVFVPSSSSVFPASFLIPIPFPSSVFFVVSFLSFSCPILFFLSLCILFYTAYFFHI